MIRVIVAGSRTITNGKYVTTTLNNIFKNHQVECVIVGMAKGVDTIAYWWAKNRGIKVIECPADWDTHGKKAGHIRNSEMANNYCANYLIAFNDYRTSKGTSGTNNMLKAAKKRGLKIMEIKYVE